MFGGEEMIIRAKPTPKKAITRPGGSRFAFIRSLTDRFYRDPYKWGVIKCITFFAASVFVAKTLSDLDILPVEPPSSQGIQSAY